MNRLPDFNYEQHIKDWGTWPEGGGEKIPWGEPSDEVIERAKMMGNMAMHKLDIGLSLSDLSDIMWSDKLWDVQDDDELFYRVKENLAELIEDSFSSARERKKVVADIWTYEIDGGKVIKWKKNY